MLLFSCVFAFLQDALSQVNPAFVRHLSNSGLRTEHNAYLNLVRSSPDSIAYFKARFYLQYFNDSLFYSSYAKSRELLVKDSLALNAGSILFMKNESPFSDLWFTSLKNETVNTSTVSMLNFYGECAHPLTADMGRIPEPLQKDFLALKKASGKKPAAAAVLSAVVPGLGRAYAGRNRSFMAAIVAHAVYGLQSYESIRKQGIKAPLSIINLGFFGMFYFSNIYGSYRDVKQVKRETKRQLLIHAADYYSAEYTGSLY